MVLQRKKRDIFRKSLLLYVIEHIFSFFLIYQKNYVFLHTVLTNISKTKER